MAKTTSRVAWTMLAGVALSAASFTPVVNECGNGRAGVSPPTDSAGK